MSDKEALAAALRMLRESEEKVCAMRAENARLNGWEDRASEIGARAEALEARWHRLRALVSAAAPLTALDGADPESRGKAAALAIVLRAMDEIEAAKFVGGKP